MTSGARLMANMLRKALVEAYVTAKGLGMQAAALLVYTKQPFRLSSICMQTKHKAKQHADPALNLWKATMAGDAVCKA